MNTIEAYKILEELDIFASKTIKSQYKYMWPIVKSWLWRYFLYGNKKLNRKDKIYLKVKNFFIYILNSTFNLFFYISNSKSSKVNIIFISRKVLKTKLPNGIFLIDFQILW